MATKMTLAVGKSKAKTPNPVSGYRFTAFLLKEWKPFHILMSVLLQFVMVYCALDVV